MTPDDLLELQQEVRGAPKNIGARLRFGQALIEAGQTKEGADQLRLAARLDPSNPHLALMATQALITCGRERDAALLLSTQIAPTRCYTPVATCELTALQGLLCHPEPFVRCHIARALGRLRIAQACDDLERACGDRNFAVRMAASSSLRLLLAH
jgi:protein involved in temperature-dependent protein secretion